MKNVSYNIITKTILILIIIWSCILIFIYAIPSLNSSINFVCSTKYEIVGGYADKHYIQGYIIYPILFKSVYILLLIPIITFSIILIFNKNKNIKPITLTIIIQNLLTLTFHIWNEYLIGVLDIALFLCLCIIFICPFVIMLYRKNFLLLTLFFVTLIQIINILSINVIYDNVYEIFRYFGLIFIIILYWLLILCNYKNIDNSKK